MSTTAGVGARCFRISSTAKVSIVGPSAGATTPGSDSTVAPINHAARPESEA